MYISVQTDGLAVCRKTPRQTEILKKQICKIFANNGLKITIDANKKVVDFLDITLDLSNGTYKPYMKPNNTLIYVHQESNHPPSILKNIPESINKRLSTISSDKDIFDKAAPPYQEALKKSGYTYKLEYKPPINNNQPNKRTRHRNITWFNPPFNDNVSTNVGKQFFLI